MRLFLALLLFVSGLSFALVPHVLAQASAAGDDAIRDTVDAEAVEKEAQRADWTIRWIAPLACGDARGALERVQALVSEASPGPWLASVRISAPDAEGAPWTLALAVEGPMRGIRALSGASCPGLVESVALILALTFGELDAEALARLETTSTPTDATGATGPQPEPTSEPETAPDPDPEREPELSADKQEPGRSEWSLGFMLEIPFDLGGLPGPSGGGGLSLFAHHRFAGLELAGRVLAPSEADGANGAIASVFGYQLEGRVCGHARVGPMGLGACGYGGVGELVGEGRGVDTPQAGAALWASAGLFARARAHLPLGFRIQLDVGAAFELSSPVFELDGVAVHEPALASFRAVLGLGWGGSPRN